ncbi:MafI family immunity protein [Mucilaginibacter sp. Mucisp86]|uniref:MafI family immunity protein n=1 Tax=Mucilaginibacter sp. Mucisp86 TaxID=3243060 RepID=UPI0039B52BB8
MLIDLAGQLGLSGKDLAIAKDYLEYNELGLSFDHVITQIYEYNVEINKALYSMVVDIASELKLPANEYDFLILLIKQEVS